MCVCVGGGGGGGVDGREGVGRGGVKDQRTIKFIFPHVDYR